MARRLPKLLSLALQGERDERLEAEQLAMFPREPGGWLVAALGAWIRGERTRATGILERAKTATGSPLLQRTPPFLDDAGR
jgi:hypothetical protein